MSICSCLAIYAVDVPGASPNKITKSTNAAFFPLFDLSLHSLHSLLDSYWSYSVTMIITFSESYNRLVSEQNLQVWVSRFHVSQRKKKHTDYEQISFIADTCKVRIFIKGQYTGQSNLVLFIDFFVDAWRMSLSNTKIRMSSNIYSSLLINYLLSVMFAYIYIL